MPPKTSSEWTFNLRTGAGACSGWDSSSDSDSDTQATEGPIGAGAGKVNLEENEEAAVPYKRNPFSIAKINAALRGDQSSTSDARKEPMKPKGISTTRKGTIVEQLKQQSAKAAVGPTVPGKMTIQLLDRLRGDHLVEPTLVAPNPGVKAFKSVPFSTLSTVSVAPSPRMPQANANVSRAATLPTCPPILPPRLPSDIPKHTHIATKATTSEHTLTLPTAHESLKPRGRFVPPSITTSRQNTPSNLPSASLNSIRLLTAPERFKTPVMTHTNAPFSSPPKATDYLDSGITEPTHFSSPIRPFYQSSMRAGLVGSHAPNSCQKAIRPFNPPEYRNDLPGGHPSAIDDNDAYTNDYQPFIDRTNRNPDFITRHSTPLHTNKKHDPYTPTGQQKSRLHLAPRLPDESSDEEEEALVNPIRIRYDNATPHRRSTSPSLLGTPKRFKFGGHTKARKDAYDFNPVDPDEEFTTLPKKGKRNVKGPSPVKPKRTQKFRIPTLTGQLPPGTKSGMSATAGRRVITFLPPPLPSKGVGTPNRPKTAERRGNRAYPSPKRSGASPAPSSSLPNSPERPVAHVVEASDEGMDKDDPFRPLSPPPSDDKLYTSPALKRKRSSEDRELDFHMGSVAMRYPKTKAARRERRRLSEGVWDLLELPSCGMVYRDPFGELSRDAKVEVGITRWGGRGKVYAQAEGD